MIQNVSEFFQPSYLSYKTRSYLDSGVFWVVVDGAGSILGGGRYFWLVVSDWCSC